jgi:hypothetical protein
MWNLGFSVSEGTYLRPEALPTLLPGRRFEDYRQKTLAQDLSFAWHHLQVWAEIYETRFAIPRVGNADTWAYYLEAKYKFTPQFFGAVRWNQQVFSKIPTGAGTDARWGANAWRIDVAPGYRFTAHTELKLQYSLLHEEVGPREFAHLLAAQFVLRF